MAIPLRELNVVAVIPARYGSTRLPGKSLMKIGERPMIQWVALGVQKSKRVSRVIVATDDARILDCVQEAGVDAVMTPDLPSGTDRVAWTVRDLDAEIVVNVQGDEPFIAPEDVDTVIGLLINDQDAVMSTLVNRISNPAILGNHDIVKVVLDDRGDAVYFSRQAIPFCRDEADAASWIIHHDYYSHVGIYGFRKSFLMDYTEWSPTPLERAEKLEQLRAIEKGYRIKTAVTHSLVQGVDTQEDLENARRYAQEQGL